MHAPLGDQTEGMSSFLQRTQGNSAFYPAFVVATIDALQSGRTLRAGIEDNLVALRLVDTTYWSAAQGEGEIISREVAVSPTSGLEKLPPRATRDVGTVRSSRPSPGL